MLICWYIFFPKSKLYFIYCIVSYIFTKTCHFLISSNSLCEYKFQRYILFLCMNELWFILQISCVRLWNLNVFIYTHTYIYSRFEFGFPWLIMRLNSFLCSLVIRVSSFVTYLFKSFTHCFWMISYWFTGVLYIIWV